MNLTLRSSGPIVYSKINSLKKKKPPNRLLHMKKEYKQIAGVILFTGSASTAAFSSSHQKKS